MDDYNVLVLMQKESDTGFLTETIDSYTINSGLEYIEGIYLKQESDGIDYIYLTLTTKEVEDWEYIGIYDLYDESIFDASADVIDGSGEYNPRWILKFIYSEDRDSVQDKINSLLKKHVDELSRINPILESNKDKYVEDSLKEEI